METKKVTVIVPLYNGEQYVERSVLSCINSENFDINYLKILLLDDGSTDNSKVIATKLASQYAGIVEYSYHENVGVCETRNIGIKKVQSTYFTFLDQDDYVDSDFIYRLYSSAEKHKSDITVSGLRRTDQNGKTIKRSLHIALINKKMTTLLSASCWGKLYRTSFAEDVRFESLNIGEDIGFLASLMPHSPKIKILGYIGYNWFFNATSVSNTKLRSLSANAKYIMDLQKHLYATNPADPYIASLATVYSCYGVFFAGKYDNDDEWCKYAKKVMENLEALYPKYGRNVAFWLSLETFLNPLSFCSKFFVILYKLRMVRLLAKSRHFVTGL